MSKKMKTIGIVGAILAGAGCIAAIIFAKKRNNFIDLDRSLFEDFL